MIFLFSEIYDFEDDSFSFVWDLLNFGFINILSISLYYFIIEMFIVWNTVLHVA